VLGPEDQVTVAILGAGQYPEFAQPMAMVVRPDGKISLGRLGELSAAGKTAGQLKTEIEQGLLRFFRRPPAVNVAVTGFRQPGVIYVLVEGEHSNAFPYRKGVGALEALALAGGASIHADLKHVTVIRADGSQVKADLAKAQQNGDPSANVSLQAGDVVTVPRLKPRKVVVVGGVNKQGPLEVMDDITVAEALKLAEGPREKADLKGATITTRDGRTVAVDLEKLLRDGDMTQNVKLGDGDTLLVPEKLIRIYVAGEVKKPDTLVVRAGTTLVQAVTECGWFTKDADLKQVVLARHGQGGEVQPQKLDLHDLGSSKNAAATATLAQTVALQDGDFIIVPTRGRKKRAEDYLPFVYPLEVLRRLIIP
jgi:polysaccharide export outer membrane protein